MTQYVYFIGKVGGLGPTKIGLTSNPNRRMATLRPYTPFPVESYCCVSLFEGAINLERSLHLHFSNRKMHGEWFDISKDDIEPALLYVLDNPRIRIKDMDVSFSNAILGRPETRKDGDIVAQYNERLAYNAAYQRDLRTIKRLNLNCTVAEYRKQQEK